MSIYQAVGLRGINFKIILRDTNVLETICRLLAGLTAPAAINSFVNRSNVLRGR